MRAGLLGGAATAAVLSAVPVWPLPTWPRSKSAPFGKGSGRGFGASRASSKHPHVHMGIDLGPGRAGELGRAAGAPVVAPFAGVVAKIGGWMGSDTRRIELLTPVGRIVLGAVAPNGMRVKVGQPVYPGQHIAELGQYPSGASMLHFEWWIGPRGGFGERGQSGANAWKLGGRRPVGLRNPTLLMKYAVNARSLR